MLTEVHWISAADHHPTIIDSIPSAADRATRPEEAVVIARAQQVNAALEQITQRLRLEDRYPTIVIPIMRGGARLGQYISEHTGFPLLPIRMSNYDPDTNQRLASPIMVEPPNERLLTQMVQHWGNVSELTMLFADTVVESGGTITAAAPLMYMYLRNAYRAASLDFPPVRFAVEALLYKGHPLNNIYDPLPPGVRAKFVTPLEYWVQGYGCDDGGQGRELDEIRARISPFA